MLLQGLMGPLSPGIGQLLAELYELGVSVANEFCLSNFGVARKVLLPGDCPETGLHLLHLELFLGFQRQRRGDIELKGIDERS